MPIRYDKKTDTLHISIRKTAADPYEIETGNYAVLLGDEDELTDIIIQKASQFMGQAAAAGVKSQATPKQKKKKPVWEDVDSSMISAFKYDEDSQTLEVAFNRTGIYQYYDVPPDIVDGLRESSSKGSYMRSMIIDMYAYTKGKR